MKIDPLQYTADYIQHVEEDSSPNYARMNRYTIQKFAEYCDQEEIVLDLDKQYEAADAILNFFKEGWMKPHNTYLTHIRGLIGYIADQHDSQTYYKLDDLKDKLKGERLPDVEKENGQFQAEWLDDAEIEAACEEGTDLQELIVRVLFETGCRRGEVAALTPEDIMWNPPQEGTGAAIRITKTNDGSGGTKSPKTELGRRIVELTPGTADMLQSYINEQGVAEDDYIFDNNPTLIYEQTKKAFRTAGIHTYDNGEKTKVTPHWLRHNRNTRIRKNPDLSEADREQYMGNDEDMGHHYTQFDENEVQGLLGK